MSFKRFGPQDLVYNTLVAKPEYKFIIHNGKVYKNNEILPSGDFSNTLKHITNGELSFHELNVNRPSDSLVYGFISKDTTRYSYRTISAAAFDDSSSPYGSITKQEYPLKAGINRIYIPDGPEFDDRTFANVGQATSANTNKKYIRALKNVINSREQHSEKFDYGTLGTSKVNIICVPAIFYGSGIDKGSIELNYYVTGTLAGRLQDVNKNGILVETYGPRSGSSAGVAIYEQGLMLLTGSWNIAENTDVFGVGTKPSWLSFGTGLSFVGEQVTHGAVLDSSYEINFKGTNKIPTLTMMAHAGKSEFNYSNNPSFLESSDGDTLFTDYSFSEPTRTIKNITKSRYNHYSASLESTTFISKVGIYDENKNLIAIATLANPLKKTPSRDYMIKMRLDF